MERELIAVALIVAVLVAALLFRRRSTTGPDRVDPADFGLEGEGREVVAFTSQYCIPCRHWRELLDTSGVAATYVDVAARPQLARRYHVHTTPLVLLVELPSGRVAQRWSGEPPERLTLAT